MRPRSILASFSAGLLAFLLLPATSSGAAIGPPRIIAGTNEDNVSLPGGNSLETVATMHLPKGVWVVIAKLNVTKVVTGQDLPLVECSLTSGQAQDSATVYLQFDSNTDPGSLPIQLSIPAVIKASSGQAAVVQCREDGAPADEVEAGQIQMTAIQAGRLTIVDMSGTVGPKTFGPPGAVPNIVFGRRGQNSAIPESNAFVTLATLALPQGRRSVLGKIHLNNGSHRDDALPAIVRCTLGAGTVSDESDVNLSTAGAAAGGPPATSIAQAVSTFGLGQVFSSGSGGKATLRCAAKREGAGATVSVAGGGIHIIAIQAGRLTLVPLGGSGSPSSFGPVSGIPRIVSGFESGPVDVATLFGSPPPPDVIASLHVPQGSWAIQAKAWLQNTSAVPVGVVCHLVAGKFSDQILPTPQASGVAPDELPVQLAIAPSFPSSAGGRVKLTCGSTGATGDVKARSVNITAIRAGTFIRVKI